MDIEEGGKILTTKLVIYDDATKGDNYAVLTNVDTSVEVDIGCIRLVFLNKFVGDILVGLILLGLSSNSQLKKMEKTLTGISNFF